MSLTHEHAERVLLSSIVDELKLIHESQRRMELHLALIASVFAVSSKSGLRKIA